MRIFYTPHFKRSFRKLPKEIQDKFEKQINFFLSDISHPSLQVKKYDKEKEIWQARVDKNVRFYFLVAKDAYILLEIKCHPK